MKGAKQGPHSQGPSGSADVSADASVEGHGSEHCGHRGRPWNRRTLNQLKNIEIATVTPKFKNIYNISVAW